MRCNFKTLISILTIISFLFPPPVLAKIIPKEIKKDKKVQVITIKNGDTLWDLAKLYYKDSFMWKKFEELNIITNPDLIFPGEKLVISEEDAKRIKEILEKRAIEVKEKIKEAKVKKEVLE
ncbi:MAG: LysM peptidoglycan-binding domain-containing protein, partial [bacterium]